MSFIRDHLSSCYCLPFFEANVTCRLIPHFPLDEKFPPSARAVLSPKLSALPISSWQTNFEGEALGGKIRAAVSSFRPISTKLQRKQHTVHSAEVEQKFTAFNSAASIREESSNGSDFPLVLRNSPFRCRSPLVLPS